MNRHSFRPEFDPIGVFDSGIGGLTVAAALKKLLPSETILYIGDTARVHAEARAGGPSNVIALKWRTAPGRTSEDHRGCLQYCLRPSRASMKELFKVPVQGVVTLVPKPLCAPLATGASV